MSSIKDLFDAGVPVEEQVQLDEQETKRKWRRVGQQSKAKEGLRFGTDGRKCRLRGKNVARYVRSKEGVLVRIEINQSKLTGK